MAHFAKLVNGVVVDVLVVPDEHENDGENYLRSLGFDGDWLRTSYNTFGGQHFDSGVPFRKNYACIGYTYDAARDAFLQPQPYASWILDEETGWWNPPVPRPSDGAHEWDEDSGSWVSLE